MMKKLLALILLVAAAVPVFAADVSVSVTVGDPRFYGPIDIVGFPQPQLVYPEPVFVQPAPAGVVFARTSDLPPALQRFRPDSLPEIAASGPGDAPLQISFPPEGARIDLSGSDSDAGLALKAMGGAPPFTWFADGMPIVIGEPRRETEWEKPGKGFARLSGIDSRGHTASVQVRLE